MNDRILSEGVVFAFSAFFRHDTPVRLQIWRPTEAMDADDVNATETSGAVRAPFVLLGETRLIPSVTNAREDVSFFSLLKLYRKVWENKFKRIWLLAHSCLVY